MLEQNTSFGGAKPLAPILNIPVGVIRAQSILFASLSITLLVAFITMLGKQWILHSIPFKTRGNIVERGKGRQIKLTAFQGWGLRLIMGSPPFMLQFALLLFYAAVIVYLWNLNVSVGTVILAVTSVGLAFYMCIIVVTMIQGDFAFRTIFSALSLSAKKLTGLTHLRLRRVFTVPLSWIKQTIQHSDSLKRAFRISGSDNTHTHYAAPCAFSRHYSMTLSNPGLWRRDPLFTSPLPKDTAASAGFWLLENSTDFSAASAVAAIFSEIQWPSHYRSTVALYQLRDTYAECVRAPELKESARLGALQSAAAYYVLYHTQLIWNTWASFEVETQKLPADLPPDLFLGQHNHRWGGDDVFEYLLRVEDRQVPVTSAQFLSYIAPYWFCGDSDGAINIRPSRLETLNELIEVLEKCRALNLATITDCMLCVGAAMDFPLHPEDLIRVDKRYVFLLLCDCGNIDWG